MKKMFIIFFYCITFCFPKIFLIEKFNCDIICVYDYLEDLIFSDNLALIYSQDFNHFTINYYNQSLCNIETYNLKTGELISKETSVNSQKAIFYFPNSDKNYIILSKDEYWEKMQIIFEDEYIELNGYSFSFTFFADCSLMIIMNKLSAFNLEYLFYNYPPKKEADLQYFESKENYYLDTILGLYDEFVQIKLNYKDSQIIMEIKKKDLSVANSHAFSLNPLENDIYLSYINSYNKHIFLFCYCNLKGTLECSVIKYENNNLIIGEFLKTVDSDYFNTEIRLSLLEDNKIAFSYVLYDSIYISILEYSSGMLNKGKYFNSKLKEILNFICLF